jgi:hypothetical protein
VVVLKPAFYTRRAGFLIVALAAATGLWLGRPGPLTAVDQQQPRLNMTAPPPHGDATIGQTFTAQHNGLSAVEVLSSVPSDSTTSALDLRLLDSGGRTLAAATFANLKHNQPLRLSFNPLVQSQGNRYTLLISADATNRASVWAYGPGGYEAGALQVSGTPGAADLQFSTDYTLLWSDLLRQAALALGRLALWAIPLGLVLFGPGLLLIDAGLRLGRGLDDLPGLQWGLALALSLSVLPLVWLWATVLGMHLSAPVLTVAYALVGAALLWRRLARLRRRPALQAGGRERLRIAKPGPALMLGAIVLFSLVVRLLAVRDLAFPSWVDSPHHALIVSLMEASGRVPDNYLPLLPIHDFIYHFGFHALAATLAWLTGGSTPDLFLLLGQVLNALAPLGIYTLVTSFCGRPRAGLLAAFFVGLVSLFPAYYVSWGRYTQLTGCLILAPAVAAVWMVIPPARGLLPSEGDWRQKLPGIVIIALLAGGLALTHYRVLIFFAVAVWVTMALGGRGGWKLLLPAALLAGLMASPWLVRLTTRALLPALAAPGGLAAENGYNALPTAYFQTGLERGWLVIAALAAGYGLLKRARPAWFAVAWTAVTFALLNIGPGTWVVNNNSWAIMLFVPGSLALGWGGDTWLQAAQSLGQATSRWGRVVGLTQIAVFAGLVAWAGLRGAAAQIGVANPVTVLAQGADAQALDWVEKNTPPASVFLVNGWEWTPGIWAGSDGGAWLLPLTGRRTTLPPLDYIEAPDLKAEVNDFNSRAAALQAAGSPETLAWLRAKGITHIFIGAHGGFLKPEMFLAETHYQLLYTNGPTWVFAVR